MGLNNTNETRRSVQAATNQSFDEVFQQNTVEIVGYDASAAALRRITVNADGSLQGGSTPYAKKITESGGATYIAYAAVGSAQASAVWQAKKIAESAGTTTTTWADGNASFDNVATDLTALTYS